MDPARAEGFVEPGAPRVGSTDRAAGLRAHVVPLLSEAPAGEPGSCEVPAAAEGGAVTEHGSLLAVDAERGL
ncbi:MAG: hypothetical protein ACRDRG_01085 [Pseudonocardiaceae bacterium]